MACRGALYEIYLMLTRNIEYLDKTLVNYANVMGLQADAGITGTEPSTTTQCDRRDVELI